MKKINIDCFKLQPFERIGDLIAKEIGMDGVPQPFAMPHKFRKLRVGGIIGMRHIGSPLHFVVKLALNIPSLRNNDNFFALNSFSTRTKWSWSRLGDLFFARNQPRQHLADQPLGAATGIIRRSVDDVHTHPNGLGQCGTMRSDASVYAIGAEPRSAAYQARAPERAVRCGPIGMLRGNCGSCLWCCFAVDYRWVFLKRAVFVDEHLQIGKGALTTERDQRCRTTMRAHCLCRIII
jgi:hypothetical protein